MHTIVDTATWGAITAVDDTDAPNASNIMTASAGLANRTRYLYRSSPGKIVALHDDPGWGTTGSWAAGAYQPGTDGVNLVTLPFLPQSGDTLEFELSGTMYLGNANPTDGEIRLYQSNINGGTLVAIPGAIARVTTASTNLEYRPFALRGQVAVASTSVASPIIYVAGKLNAGTVLSLAGSYALSVTRYERAF